MSNDAHISSICESNCIGQNTTFGAFCHIRNGAIIGCSCKIGSHTFIDNNVIIGNNVIIESGVYFEEGVNIYDNVHIGQNVSFSNRIQFVITSTKTQTTNIFSGVHIGANSTITRGITIGQQAMVEAGSVLTSDVPAKAIVKGNPAYIDGYVDAPMHQYYQHTFTQDNQEKTILETSVPKVTLHNLKSVKDLRGNLSVGDFDKDIPFVPHRYFIVYDVSNRNVRGEHAHKKCQQFLVCVKGSIRIFVDNGNVQEEIVLDRPSVGLYLPPMVWAVEYKHSPEGVLLVFASDKYDPDDYIRNYEEYLSATVNIN